MTPLAHPTLRPAAPRPARPSISVVLPAFNEAGSLAGVLDEVRAALAGLGASLYRLAFDLRVLQSPPVGELSEPFGSKQVGSSAMPFKRNPINAEKIKVTGDKMNQKIYWRHSGYPGGIKSRTLAEMLDKQPEEVIRKAVKGMMPRNKLSRQQLLKLKVHAGPEHNHQAQQPKPLEIQN